MAHNQNTYTLEMTGGGTTLNYGPFTAAYVEVDANIDFYEQNAIFGTAGVFFRW